MERTRPRRASQLGIHACGMLILRIAHFHRFHLQQHLKRQALLQFACNKRGLMLFMAVP